MSAPYTTTAAEHVAAPIQREVTHRTGGHPDNDTIDAKNRVQWGPIIAGVLTALATLLILSLLGVAIGSSALAPRDVGQSLGTGAAIYGAISAIIAFFIGGFIAAKTAAVGGVGSGMINGLMVGAAILALILVLAGSGLGSILGSIGTNITDVTNIADNVSGDPAAQQTAFDTVKNSSWGTLAGIVLALAAATVGGIVGHNDRRDLVATA